MRHIRHRHAKDGSALVLTLLVTALLTTIAVSFLSTSRIEQIAAKNFTRQNAASGLAEMATQQAMANIALGFNTTGNATGTYTSVVTTQPGAIHKYFFENGTVSQNTTVELFSSGNLAITSNNSTSLTNLGGNSSSETANMNNLSNPMEADAGNLTLTGNSSDRINVSMEEVRDSDGNLVGRIAYYVDDEGTKLNLNAATGDRPSLNVGSSRSLSLSSLASAAQATDFTQVVNGNATSNSSATTDIKNWAHFFRPEQISGAVSGFTLGNIPKLSTAPVAGKDYHLKRTPWGTPRLFINDLQTDTANATASVNAIYNALSDTRLSDIYGSTFADKYTPLGLKQIAANILQMKDPNTNTASNSFTSTVPRIGANGSQLVAIANCCYTANNTKIIPAEYFGKAPYPYINEIGVTVAIAHRDMSPNTGNPLYQWTDDNMKYNTKLGFQIRPFVSIVNPESSTIPKSEVDTWKIQMRINSFTFDMEHEDATGNTYTYSYGPTGYENGDAFGHTPAEKDANIAKRNSKSVGAKIKEYLHPWGWTSGLFSTTSSGNYSKSTWGGVEAFVAFSSWSQNLTAGQELQLSCHYYAGGWDMDAFVLDIPNPTKIKNIFNMQIKFDYIILSSVTGGTEIIRDFALEKDTGYIDCWLQAPSPGQNALNPYPNGWPEKALGASHPWVYGVTPTGSDKVLPPKKSVKRIDGRLRLTANSTSSNSTRAWSASGNSSWVKNTALWPAPMRAASNNATTANAEAYPSVTSGKQIPGDPPVTTQTDPLYDFPTPFSSNLQFTSTNTTTPNSSVFTSPQELGKVHTNAPHRKLRFTTQHPNEKSITTNATTIPDWAMLDVISFGSNVTTVPLPAPVNLNGKFYVPSGSLQPAARTAGLESALKALDSASTIGSPFPPFSTANTTRSQYIGGSGNVSSTIAGNIGNLTWSTGNFTSGNSTWSTRRNAANFPANQFVLPAEVTEIRSVSDVLPLDTYTGNSTNIKGNEGRLSALFPGATTQSRFFTIYAYAQALDKNFAIDSEAVTKTLVEVVENTSTTPSTYTVKKLYTQPIQAQ